MIYSPNLPQPKRRIVSYKAIKILSEADRMHTLLSPRLKAT